MTGHEDTRGARRVVAQCSISIDGYSSGPGGPQHDQWLYRTATDPATAAHTASICSGADTALLGRRNFVGFAAVWPGITADPASDGRTRDLGRWLASVEKHVLSSSLTQADVEAVDWGPVTVSTDLPGTVRDLRTRPGRDILVLNSASIVQQLLVADLVDDLHLTVLPTILGGGLRLLPDDVVLDWSLSSSQTFHHGGVALHYVRARADRR